MAIAEQLDLRSEQLLTQAFFALHGPLTDAVREGDADAVGETIETVRELVVDTIARQEAQLSVVARDEVRQLGWITSKTTQHPPAELVAALAEWDQLLAISATAAAARDARQRNIELRQTLAERIVELLADSEMRPADIATSLGATRAHVSRALRQLREDGIVEAAQRPGHDGRGAWYRAVQIRAAV